MATPSGAFAASTPVPEPSPSLSNEADTTPTPTPTAPADPESADQPVSDGSDVPDADQPADGAVIDDAPSTPAPAVPHDTVPEAETAPRDARGPPAIERDAATPVPLARQLNIGILAAGIPEAPREVWSETFEQGLGTTAPSGLGTYASGRYTASPGWLNGAGCTGVLVNYSAGYPNSSFCPSQGLVLTTAPGSIGARETRRLADVLGQVAGGVSGSTSASTPVNGSSAATQANHALVAYPYAAVAGGTTVAQTTAAIGVTAANPRYYLMRFDAAAAQCNAGSASLTLSLVNGTTTVATTGPAAPCSATGPVHYTSPTLPVQIVGDPLWAPSARAATYASAATLLTPAQIGSAQMRLTNTVTAPGSASGVDNIRVLDVTPALDVAFGPTPTTATVPTTLTYTVTNSSDLLAKSDWGFSAALPAGLTVAPNPGVAGSCANATGTPFTVTAAAGGSSIVVAGGDLAAGSSSCTVSVSVVAAAAGTYSSGTVTGAGVVASAATSVTVAPATTITLRKNITARGAAADQFTLSVRSGQTVLASATTSGSATGIQPQQISTLTVQPGSTYTIHETITNGAGLTYASSYECTRGGTVIAVGSSPSGTITMPADQGAAVVCTFTNTPQTARLSCTTNQFYALAPSGELVQSDTVSGVNATVGTWNVGADANALGIASNGSVAYAIRRSTDAANVTSMLKWTPAGGFQTLAGSAYTTVTRTGAPVTGSIVAGAVDLSGSRFVFGKFSGSAFHLWSFTESNPAASRYAYLGSFSASGSPNGNGDLAFDSRGNLYVVGASNANNVASAVIFTVTAENLAAANGGVLAATATIPRSLSGTDATPAFANANGIAFSPRGTAYISDAATAYEFDPTTWTRIPGSARTLDEHTDLASCSTPSTITVLKNAVGRAVASDQFTFSLANAGTPVATATTEGSVVGRQPQQIGPIPAPIGATLTLAEAMAPGSTSPIGAYTTFYECWADGVRLSNGATTSGSVTMPDRLGVNVVCTHFNSPRPATTVTVTKQVLNPATGAAAPASGWSIGTSATATVGTATVLPSEAPRQVTNAQGTATWTVLYGSTASRATIVISEELQSGFVFASATCTVNGAATPVTFTRTGNLVSGSIAGTQSASTIACTIVNRPVAVLTLVKQVSFGSALPSDWVLSAAAPTGALPGPTGRSGTPQVSAVAVTPGVPYRLSEAGGPLTYAQTGAWTCVTSGGAAVAVTAASDVTLPQGSTVTCTVVNATASITLVKQVQNPQPGFQPADWTISAAPAPFASGPLPTVSRPGAAYVAGGNAASTFEVRPSHGYTLTEAPTAPGTRLAYQTLRLERLQGTTWVSVPTATITSPPAGQTAVYRFVNAPVQPTTLPLTGGMSSDAFFISGGALMALILLGAVLHGHRRGRRLM